MEFNNFIYSAKVLGFALLVAVFLGLEFGNAQRFTNIEKMLAPKPKPVKIYDIEKSKMQSRINYLESENTRLLMLLEDKINPKPNALEPVTPKLEIKKTELK